MRRYFIVLPFATFAIACMNDNRDSGPSRSLEPDLSVSSAGTRGVERPERKVLSSFFSRTPAEIFRYAAVSDSVLSVGIKVPGERRGMLNGRWLVSAQERLARFRSLERESGILSIAADSSMPRLFVKVSDADVIARLRRMPFVDYVEPRNIPSELLRLNSFGGCSADVSGGPQPVGPSGDEIPLSFIKARIDRAWAYSNGSGAYVGILDTGANPFNQQLFANFVSGASSARRPHLQSSTIGPIPPAFQICPHGSYMAAVIAAPRDGRGTQGVAWGADLLSIRVEEGVVSIRAYDVAQGIVDATNAGARIVAMALGIALQSSAINDALDRGTRLHDVLFIGAAGTSPSWHPWHGFVVYPANHQHVMAVSGADFNGSRDPASHFGPEVEVVAYGPTTTSSFDGFGRHDFGNSSNATAVVSGVAALVRSRYPGWTAGMVRARIRSTAGTNCGPETAFGPIINAEAAVGGVCVPFYRPIGAPVITFDRRAYGDNRSSATETYCAYPSGGIAPLEFAWSNGSTVNCRSISFVRGNYTQRVSFQVRDPGVSLSWESYFLDVKVVDLDTTCPTCL